MYGHSINESSSLNKNAHNKYLIIPLIIILILGSFFSSTNSAKANPLAIAGGIEVGAGVYVTAALLVAGGATLVGYEEHGDAIKQHASDVWSGANQLAKDSLRVSMEAALSAGNTVVDLGSDLLNYLEGEIDSTAAFLAELKNKDSFNQGLIVNNGTQIISETINVYFGNAYNGTNHGYYFYTLDAKWTRIEWRSQSGSNSVNVEVPADSLRIGFSGINTISGWMSWHNRFFASVNPDWRMTVTFTPDIQSDYNAAVSRTREQWESMRDAGLVIPVDSAIPHANGKQAVYNPTDGTYTGIDGGVINPSDITWSFPVPRYRDKDVPVPGVYVDTPPLTGVPSIDESITKNPAIPKTTTNVNTGVTVLNPDIPKEANPPIEGEIPGGEVPPTTPTTPKAPGTQPIIPIAILLALFDLLRAILMYLSRMFAFLVTIPFVVAIPIDNPYFQWFRTATILGVQPYPLVMSTAAFFMSFAAYKSIRRLLP